MNDGMVVDDENQTLDPLDTEESALASPSRVGPPPNPKPAPEPIPLDEPDAPVIIEPDRPDLDFPEPLADPSAPVDLPVGDPSASPPAADPGGLMNRLETIEGGLGRKLDALQIAFDREVRAEATREKVVDRLHAELQEYKAGLILGILRPIFIDLIQLHDDIGKMAITEGESNPEIARMLTYQQAIEDILYRQGVETYHLEDDTFDPRRQRALTTVTTEEPNLNKKVAARIRKGFQSGDKVIRPEFVSVYAYKPI